MKAPTQLAALHAILIAEPLAANSFEVVKHSPNPRITSHEICQGMNIERSDFDKAQEIAVYEVIGGSVADIGAIAVFYGSEGPTNKPFAVYYRTA